MTSLRWTLLALVPTMAVAADTFDDRTLAATALEITPQGRDYLARFTDAARKPMAQAMADCFPKPADTRFTLVADGRPDGRLADLVVRPATAGPACYRAKFAAIHAPPLPEGYGEAFPLVIDMMLKSDPEPAPAR